MEQLNQRGSFPTSPAMGEASARAPGLQQGAQTALALVLPPPSLPRSAQVSSQKQDLGEQLAQSRQETEAQANALLRALQEKEELTKEKGQLAVELTVLERQRKGLLEEADTLRYQHPWEPNRGQLGADLWTGGNCGRGRSGLSARSFWLPFCHGTSLETALLHRESG